MGVSKSVVSLALVVAVAAGANVTTPFDFLVSTSGDVSTARLVVGGSGNVVVPNGQLSVNSLRYPVVHGIRTKESSSPADEATFSSVTKSSLTATRKSTLYTQAQFKAGFGTDISFQTTDSAGLTQELGTVGMAHDGKGGPSADFTIKTWNGADSVGYPGDSGDVMGPYT
jgi:hypothetical protein